MTRGPGSSRGPLQPPDPAAGAVAAAAITGMPPASATAAAVITEPPRTPRYRDNARRRGIRPPLLIMPAHLSHLHGHGHPRRRRPHALLLFKTPGTSPRLTAPMRNTPRHATPGGNDPRQSPRAASTRKTR